MSVSEAIRSDPIVVALCAGLRTKSPLAVSGLWGSSAPILAALVSESLKRPILYLTAHLDQADDALDDMETILGRAPDALPAWETLPGEGAASADIGADRARLCARLHERRSAGSARPTMSPTAEGGCATAWVIVASIQALIQPVPTVESLEAHSLTLAVGARQDPEAIAKYLLDRGFERLDQVEEPGDFALRGGILDIFSSPDADPLRIEFFGDQIESIRQFEVGTQRSQRTLESATITLPPDPARARPAETTSFLSYLPENTLIAIAEPVEVAEIGTAVINRLGNPVGHYPVDAVMRQAADFSQIHLSRFPTASAGDADSLRLNCQSLPPFEAKATDAVRQLLNLAKERPTVVYCDNEGEEQRLRELIEAEGTGNREQETGNREQGTGKQAGTPHSTPTQSSPYQGEGGGGAAPESTQPRAAVPHRDTQPRAAELHRDTQPRAAVPHQDTQPRAAEPHGQSIHTRIGLIHQGFIWTEVIRDSAAHDVATVRSRMAPDQSRDRQGAPSSAAKVAQRSPLVAALEPAGMSALDDIQFRGVAVVPHHEVFRRYTQKRRMRRVTAGRPIESFLDLAEGDYVVHVLHGIGRYVGMRTMRKADSRKSEEFLTLRFADDAVMHVPVSQIDLVQKYIGARGARPPLSKLGGSRWQTTKEKVEEAITDLASDLLRVQAARDSQPGVAFPQDTHWQKEFDAAFLYTPTPDQVTAIRDIKNDMIRPRPMDRLLCGDVGYGKTELAMRAAFKVVEFGRQVAVLVPTTVLAEQHFRTFKERMADYPFALECVNRFRSTKEQKQIAAAARKGQIDVLIGTHRLLSNDIGFADLGLVIVDEEQRFGVEHKERLKRLRTEVDVLTLTATPIPRTLHMAMIGLRDISSLATPPMDRRAIGTHVCTWSDELIREAISRELNRDGQVFFVHNRVHSIRGVADRIASLVPGARIIIGHGQMPGDELEDVMLKFVRREADVLVSTAIIESGLDIPNANTIFIDRADMFGLADLHQLRGRVGRYKHHAYCYLLLSPDRPLTSTAARRLKAIEQFSELGAGFRIAMRDLEIRGAGNILGPEQSGNIAAVGYELYCQLLEQGVKRMRGELIQPRVSVHLELDVEAYIPRSYIPSDRQRMECYRRFATCQTPEDVNQLGKDLEDAFGRYPETVDTMLTLAEIKVRAAPWNIKSIIRREPDVIFNFEGEIKKIEPLFAGSKGSVRVPDGRTLHWRLPENYFHGDTLLRILRNLFRREPNAVGPEGQRQAPGGLRTMRASPS